MTALPDADRTKLAKLLGMLGSSHVGERDAAACAAHRLVQQHGVTWHDVVTPPPVRLQTYSSPPRQPQPPEWIDDLFLAKRNQEFCTSWEQKFLSSITTASRLSPKQKTVLEKIADTLRGKGFA